MESEPPFQERYKALFEGGGGLLELDPLQTTEQNNTKALSTVKSSKKLKEECDDDDEEDELPIVDLYRQGWEREVSEAAKEWGFFQVLNHGISRDALKRVQLEQVKLFQKPFAKKANDSLLNLSAGCYSWGTPTATSLLQFSWSESFHIPCTSISSLTILDIPSSPIEEFAEVILELAQKIAEVLAHNLGCKSSFFTENCVPSSCYLRMNRYPPCPIFSKAYGLVPHTDSDFLTILYPDQLGGLQLLKNRKWNNIKPNPDALIINIGDLFQAWSNDVYKSIEHRVVTNREAERFSVACFYCPSYDAIIPSCGEPSIYRQFSFGEYRQQVREDVKSTGNKVGLPKFLA